VIVLAEANAAGVLAVRKRLAQAIQSELGEGIQGWTLDWTSVVYPEDGHSAEELLAPLRASGGGQGRPRRQRNV
jgi:hypothetical protein